jgi:hypothetical protein
MPRAWIRGERDFAKTVRSGWLARTAFVLRAKTSAVNQLGVPDIFLNEHFLPLSARSRLLRIVFRFFFAYTSRTEKRRTHPAHGVCNSAAKNFGLRRSFPTKHFASTVRSAVIVRFALNKNFS